MSNTKISALVMYSLNPISLIPFSLLLSGAFALNGVWWAYVAASASASMAVVLIAIPFVCLRKTEIL